MGIQPATVRSHVTAVFRALGVTNRTQAAGRLHRCLQPSEDPRTHRPALAEVMRRPAVAVLGMEHDGSEGAKGLALAMTQELVALFANWCSFPVIARASSRDARTLGSTTQEIGRAIGARFLLEPALRTTGDGWRLTVQLTAVQTGLTRWSGRHNLDDEPWLLLDETCASVVAAAYPMLMSAPVDRRAQSDLPAAMPSWEVAHLGHDLQSHRGA
jgi:TolB-like protein